MMACLQGVMIWTGLCRCVANALLYHKVCCENNLQQPQYTFAANATNLWAVWHSFGAYICHCSTSSKVAVWQHLVDYA